MSPRSPWALSGFRALAVVLAASWILAAEPSTKGGEAVRAEAPESGEAAKSGHGSAGAEHHDAYDLSHQNPGKMLEDPTELRSDLAIWTLVVFLCLLAVLFWFAWRPIMEGLEKRERSIEAMIVDAKQSAEKAAERLREYEAKLAAARDETREMLAVARADAEAAKEQIVADARTAAQRERERAVADIEQAKNAALAEMTHKSVDLAVFVAGRIVRRELTREDHTTLIREALDELPSRN